MSNKKRYHDKEGIKTHSLILHLKDFHEMASCPGCKSSEFDKLGEINKELAINDNIISIAVPKNYSLWKCRSCDIVFRSYITTSETELRLQDCWKNRNGEFHRWEPKRISGYFKLKKRIDKISAEVFTGQQRVSLLDIGIGEGKFIKLFEGSYTTYGMDLNPIEGIDYSKVVNGGMIYGDIEHERYQMYKSKFHIITAFDVFEHLWHPRRAIKSLYAMLKKNGLLIIETGNINSLPAKITRYRNWWYVPILEHKIFWSTKTLPIFLENNGFKIVSVRKKTHKGGVSFNLIPLIKYVIYFFSPKLYYFLMAHFKKKPFPPSLPTIPWKDHMLVVAQKTGGH